MELIRQPPGSYKCTQACVAMVAGVSLKRSIQAFGLHHATNLYALRNALRRLGFTPAEKYQSFGRKAQNLPETCLLRLSWRGQKMGHCVVYHKGEVFDPACGTAPWDLFLVLNDGASLKYLNLHAA